MYIDSDQPVGAAYAGVKIYRTRHKNTMRVDVAQHAAEDGTKSSWTLPGHGRAAEYSWGRPARWQDDAARLAARRLMKQLQRQRSLQLPL